jgi:hypothetical protein
MDYLSLVAAPDAPQRIRSSLVCCPAECLTMHKLAQVGQTPSSARDPWSRLEFLHLMDRVCSMLDQSRYNRIQFLHSPNTVKVRLILPKWLSDPTQQLIG